MVEQFRQQFVPTNQVPEEIRPQYLEALDRYYRDIGGVDLGPLGIPLISTHFLLTSDGRQLAGFLSIGDAMISPAFPEERAAYLTAAYLADAYRAKTGEHRGVLRANLRVLVDAMEADGFDRLLLFPPDILRNGLVTDIGHTHVLQPLHEELIGRQSVTARYLGPIERPTYLFRAEDFFARHEQAKAHDSSREVRGRELGVLTRCREWWQRSRK